MITLLNSVKDAFTNPDSPWYYAVGTGFLVLLIAALAVYFVIEKKRKKKAERKDSDNTAAQPEQTPEPADTKTDETPESTEPPVDTALEQAPTANDNAAEQTDEKDENTDTAKTATPEPSPVAADEPHDNDDEEAKPNAAAEKPVDGDGEVKTEENAAHTEPKAKKTAATGTKAQAPRKKPTPKQAEQKPQPEQAEQKAKAPTAAAAKPAPKKAAVKPFIDRLIAAKDTHSVYNELKNSVLSYPGVKAKLTKEREEFYFGTDKKAAIALDGSTVELYLSIAPESMPSQFKAEKSDGELPTLYKVTEDKIDDARKMIVFAMNVSMLTRNDRHRYVDYVQKAIDAKQRAKKK